MNLLRRIPIKSKLILMSMMISMLVLLLAMLAGAVYEAIELHRDTVRELSALAEVIAANSRAPLAFSDAKAAQNTLQGLDVRPAIVEARIRDRTGNLFAEYLRKGVAPAREESGPVSLGATPMPSHRFEGGHLWVIAPIVLDDETLGMVSLRDDLREHRAKLKAGAAIFITVLLVAALVAWILASRWQRLISQPILNLASVAGSVAQQKDYSLRAERESNDEIGQLVGAFNSMLTAVQESDASLRQSEERFRQLTEGIREVFWMTNVLKQEMIYISPGYERIWGRTCESLYREPRSWLDAIHPEDRERVTQAATTKQARGDYNEEYRIVRPDGTVRWILDRAFPVRNEQGEVYRIAGFAEDITERKELERRILEVSDQEQQRIGQDLHDGLCQHLTATKFAGKVLEDKLDELSLAEAADARHLGELINQAIAQARDVARGLSPVALEAEGLSNALQHLANTVERIFKISCMFDSDGKIAAPNVVMATHLYRIAQEATHNALRHAQPSQIVIALTRRNGQIVLTIGDDGRGMPETVRSGGMGLQTMRYRAGLIGATLDVRTRHGGGTEVTCAWHSTGPES